MKQSVLGIVKTPEQGHIVLIKRQDVPIWVLPGGGVDEDETPEQAVVREVLEETGLTVKITRKTGEYTPLNRLCLLTHVFECEPEAGKLTLTDETSDISFFSIQDLPKTFFSVHKDWLDDALKNLPTPLKKPITSVTYLSVIIYFFRHPLHVLRALTARLGFPINTK